MSFNDPKIGYETVRDNIITLLRDNKTDLNKNLDNNSFSNDNQIEAGDPDVKPVFRGQYPYIMLEFIGKDEESRGVGASHTKTPQIRYRLYGFVKLRKKYEDIDAEVMNLLDNIEGIIRDNIKNIGDTHYVLPGSSEKGSGERNGTFVSIIALDIIAQVEVS